MLRGGTMNTVSNALRLPRGTPEKNLARLLARTANGTPPATAVRSTLKAGPSGASRIGFLFGTGVFQSFLREYYKRGKDDPSTATAVETFGVMAASALVQGPIIKQLAEPTHLELEVDGRVFPPNRYMAVTAGTVEQVGLGFTPFYLADRFHGAFHLLALTEVPSKVVRDLPRVWLGLPISPANGEDLIAKRATLRSPDGTGIDYMIDGDLYTANDTVVIENGPLVRIVTS
jgi:diacylglycerol kinase family enzyme